MYVCIHPQICMYVCIFVYESVDVYVATCGVCALEFLKYVELAHIFAALALFFQELYTFWDCCSLGLSPFATHTHTFTPPLRFVRLLSQPCYLVSLRAAFSDFAID